MTRIFLVLAILLVMAPLALAGELTTYVTTVTTTGGSGSATGSATTVMMPGYLEDVYVDYGAGAPSTTDVTLAYAGRGGNILAVANYATDILITPRLKPVDNATASITNAYDRFPLWDKVAVTVADAATPSVTIYLRVFRP